MAVTVSVDIGTAIIPLSLDDRAIAYAVSYAPDFSTASVDIRHYTVSDQKAGLTPSKAFQKLVSETPGIWTDTYSNLDSLHNMDGVDDEQKFIHIKLRYDEDRYSWIFVTDAAAEFMYKLMAGGVATIPKEMLGLESFATKDQKNKNK